MLITFEGEVPQRSDASQNDHKSKGYPSKTSEAAFTMQKADKGDLRRLARPPLKWSFKEFLTFAPNIFTHLNILDKVEGVIGKISANNMKRGSLRKEIFSGIKAEKTKNNTWFCG